MMIGISNSIGSLLHGGGGGQSYDPKWYLAGGLIPESTDYTVYDPLAAADLASSYVNLANPGVRDAVPGVAPTHAQGSGWTFNGTDQYLKTATPAVEEQTVIIWVENASGAYAIGSFISTAPGLREGWIRPISSTNTAMRRAGQTRQFVGPTIGGILGYTKENAFKNNCVQGNPMGTWANGTGVEFYLGAQNNAGTANNFFGGRILRVAIYNLTLTTEQFEAATLAMYNYLQPAAHAYQSQVLALSPICYWPCTQAIGSPCFDVSGNKAHGEAYGITAGQTGLKGFSIAGNGNANNTIKTVRGWQTKTGLDVDEFGFACLMKVNVDASNQIRVMNLYTGSQNEYFACEIRNGNKLGLFCRENGNDQSDSAIVNITDGQWHHIVCYNSLSAGKIGVYLDGQNFEVTKTLTGFSNKTVDETYPFSGQDLDGNLQHLVYFDHAPSQSEVNALLP